MLPPAQTNVPQHHGQRPPTGGGQRCRGPTIPRTPAASYFPFSPQGCSLDLTQESPGAVMRSTANAMASTTTRRDLVRPGGRAEGPVGLPTCPGRTGPPGPDHPVPRDLTQNSDENPPTTMPSVLRRLRLPRCSRPPLLPQLTTSKKETAMLVRWPEHHPRRDLLRSSLIRGDELLCRDAIRALEAVGDPDRPTVTVQAAIADVQDFRDCSDDREGGPPAGDRCSRDRPRPGTSPDVGPLLTATVTHYRTTRESRRQGTRGPTATAPTTKLWFRPLAGVPR
jgi:hypothetical protein